MDEFQADEKAFVVDEVNNVIKEVMSANVGYRNFDTERIVSSKQGWTVEL
jgi:hypothetical protein